MKLKNLLIGGSIGLFLFALYLYSSMPVSAASKQITILNNTFSNMSETVIEGDTVVWLNNDSVGHRLDILSATDSSLIVGNDLQPKVSTSTAGRSLSRKFNVAGNYIYRLDQQATISGTLTVTEAIATPSASATVPATATAVPTASPILTPTATPSNSPIPTAVASASVSPIPTVTASPTMVPSPSNTPRGEILPGFSVFRKTTCRAVMFNNNTQIYTDKLGPVILKRGLWNVSSFSSTANIVTIQLRLVSIRTVNLLFGGNPFFGLDRTISADRSAIFEGNSVSSVLQKAGASWCGM